MYNHYPLSNTGEHEATNQIIKSSWRVSICFQVILWNTRAKVNRGQGSRSFMARVKTSRSSICTRSDI